MPVIIARQVPHSLSTSHPDPLRREYWPVLLATAIFALLWLWQVRVSEGFLEADACTHYLISRFAFAEPYRFVDVWGRPLKTILYAGPAFLAGRLGVQATSLALAVLCAYIALLLARNAGLRRPALAYIFTLASPLVFLHSFSELTELPFAALLAVTFYLFTRRHFHLAAFLAGLLPLARPEGFGILALAALALLLRRRWSTIPLLPLGLIAWSFFGWLAYGRVGSVITWLPDHWPYAGESVYAKGRITHFLEFLPAITSPILFPALLLGALSFATGLKSHASHRKLQLLILLLPAFILTAHSLLYALGKMASNGELRYMLVVAPFWGILIAAGWERAFEILRRPSAEMIRFAAYASLVPLFINTHIYTVLPIRFDSAWQTTRFIAHWADAYGPLHNRPAIMAAHPGIFYFLDRSQNAGPPRPAYDFIRANIDHPPPGTILLFDPIYARYNATRDRRVDSTDEILAAGWIEHPTMHIGGWRIFLSPDPAPPAAPH